MSEENPHAIRISGSQYQFIRQSFIRPARIVGKIERSEIFTFCHDPNYLPIILENVPLEEQEGTWFMLDGAPPHHTNAVREQLHYLFPGRLIGRRAGNNAEHRPDIVWPPRSPDFNPCDFFFLGLYEANSL